MTEVELFLLKDCERKIIKKIYLGRKELGPFKHSSVYHRILTCIIMTDSDSCLSLILLSNQEYRKFSDMKDWFYT